MDIKMSMSDLQRMEFKQAFEEFDKATFYILIFNIFFQYGCEND